jgi:membrane-associated phospholipid phosphatase
VLEFITQLGATGLLLIVMALIGGVQAWRHHKFTVLIYLAVVGVGVSLMNNGLKLLVHRERPVVLQLSHAGGYSFPKWPRRRRRLAALVVLGITLAVASSRVLLGVHWLTDVIAGAIFGWTWFVLVTVLFGGRILRFGEPVERVAEHTVTPAPQDRHEVETPA